MLENKEKQTKNIIKNLDINIKTYLTLKRMNIFDLIETTKIDKNVIWGLLYRKIEKPEESDLIKIANALGVTVNDLIEDKSNNEFFEALQIKTDNWNPFGGATSEGKATYLR